MVPWPTDASGVRQHRMGTVQQPQLALLEWFDVIHQLSADVFPAWPSGGERPDSTHSLKGTVGTGEAST